MPERAGECMTDRGKAGSGTVRTGGIVTVKVYSARMMRLNALKYDTFTIGYRHVFPVPVSERGIYLIIGNGSLGYFLWL